MDPLLEKWFSGFSSTVLIDFYADWCEPCSWVVPVLDEVGKHFNEKIKIVKINIDEHPEITKSLMILSVPTLILFVDTKEVWRMRGFDTAPSLINILGNFV